MRFSERESHPDIFCVSERKSHRSTEGIVKEREIEREKGQVCDLEDGEGEHAPRHLAIERLPAHHLRALPVALIETAQGLDALLISRRQISCLLFNLVVIFRDISGEIERRRETQREGTAMRPETRRG